MLAKAQESCGGESLHLSKLIRKQIEIQYKGSSADIY